MKKSAIWPIPSYPVYQEVVIANPVAQKQKVIGFKYLYSTWSICINTLVCTSTASLMEAGSVLASGSSSLSSSSLS